MVVDEYVGRCLDVGSTPTGSIKTRGVSLLFVYIGIYYEKTFVFDRFLNGFFARLVLSKGERT